MVDAATVAQFVRFALARVVGFLANLAAVYSLEEAAAGLSCAGAIAFVAAASATCLINRRWTSRGHAGRAARRRWAADLGADPIGFGRYDAIHAGCVALVPICARLSAPAIAGLFANFTLSRRIALS